MAAYDMRPFSINAGGGVILIPLPLLEIELKILFYQKPCFLVKAGFVFLMCESFFKEKYRFLATTVQLH